MRTRSLIATLLVVAALTGCSDGPSEVADEASPSAAPSPTDSASAEASPSPVAAEVDPTVVPPVEQMTPAYVEAVVNTIEARSGELFAQVLAEPVNPLGALPDGVFQGLQALFAGDRLAMNIEEAEALAESEAAREFVLPSERYVGIRYEIVQVSYAEPGCIIAIGRINRDGTTPDGGPDATLSLLSLVRSNEAMNPTAWAVTESMANVDAAGEPNTDEFALESTFADFESVVAHDCVNGEASRVP